MNRALICASYSENLQLLGESSCDDVVKMKEAVLQLRSYSPNKSPGSEQMTFDCGAAGTVLRFLSLRLSRIPGRHILKATKRLMQRPQQDLLDVFYRLGVSCELSENQMILQSEGWKNISEPLLVHRGVSSQFASGLLLNAWDLEEDLVLTMVGNPLSEAYLEMSLRVLQELGMKIEIRVHEGRQQYIVKAHSAINQGSYKVESDLSSAFAVAAFAALNGQATFENFPNPSLQPDFVFVDLLKKMGLAVDLSHDQLKIQAKGSFSGLEADLGSCPDLFPVLATLCAFASTPSRLYGAPQLIHKESDRISKVSELLTQLKVPHEKKTDGMLIHPKKIHARDLSGFSYDTDHDHRLAFAAALVKSQGFPIRILHPEVVSKSFPEFWKLIDF
jgi:3-phosphoshikimate 1-carboxyvinyltransferase